MGINLKDTIEGTCRKAINDKDGNSIPETYLKKTGDSKDNTASFTSADSLTPAAWADVPVLATGEKHSSILNKISTMFRNIRWLYKMLGTTNIASIGGGTLTGGISKLNTDFLKANEVKYLEMPQPPTNGMFVSFSHWVFHVTKVGRVVTITTNFAGHMKASWDNQLLLTLPAEYSPYDWYEIFPHITQGGNTILVGISHDGSVEFNSLGKEIDDWLARWCITYIARE